MLGVSINLGLQFSMTTFCILVSIYFGVYIFCNVVGLSTYGEESPYRSSSKILWAVGIVRVFSVIAAICFSCGMAFAANETGYASNGRKFGVYYGQRFLPELSSFDVLILDEFIHPDLPRIREGASVRQTLFGYVSVCELGAGRSYNAAVREAKLVLPQLSERGYEMIDIRRPEWQRMVVEEIVPRILEEGFDGIFLDTLDDAVWLEDLDKNAYAGTRDAAVALVHAIRARFPGHPIMMNCGFELLAAVGGDIDMFLAEDLLSAWEGPGFKPRLRGHVEANKELKMIAAARQQHEKLAIYSLDYWDPKDQAGIAQLYGIERSNGFTPYVATPALTEIVGEPAK